MVHRVGHVKLGAHLSLNPPIAGGNTLIRRSLTPAIGGPRLKEAVFESMLESMFESSYLYHGSRQQKSETQVSDCG